VEKQLLDISVMDRALLHRPTRPINDQLEQLRSRSDTLEEFLKKVAGFGSYREFLGYLDGG